MLVKRQKKKSVLVTASELELITSSKHTEEEGITGRKNV